MLSLFGKIVEMEARGQNAESDFTNFPKPIYKKVAVLTERLGPSDSLRDHWFESRSRQCTCQSIETDHGALLGHTHDTVHWCSGVQIWCI